MNIQDYLNEHGIAFTLYAHPPVFTCEQAKEHCAHIPGLACKNLFLSDGQRFFLVILPAEDRLGFKAFEKAVGSKVRFGSDEELMQVFCVTRGAVSPFGLVNDSAHRTLVYIAKEVWKAGMVHFHPNINTQTITLSRDMFQKYIRQVGCEWQVMS